jgi:hypothetical protein
MKCRASRLRRSLVVAALACALLAARQSGGGETVAAPQLQPSGGETAAVPNPRTRFPPLTAAMRKSFAHHLLVAAATRKLVDSDTPEAGVTETSPLVGLPLATTATVVDVDAPEDATDDSANA